MRRTWFSPRAILVHLVGLAVVAACISLCIWQYHRALGGNSLSWAYVFEWPLFAGCAVYVWWDLLHHRGKRPAIVRMVSRQPAGAGGPAVGNQTVAPAETVSAQPQLHMDEEIVDEEEDPELAAYNRYLANLNANGGSKRW